MDSLGCGLCDKRTGLSANLTLEDIRVIRSCLVNSQVHNTQIPNIFESDSSPNISFCPECEFLLREMKRVKVLVDLVDSHLDELVSKFKVQCKGKSKSTKNKKRSRVNYFHDE